MPLLSRWNSDLLLTPQYRPVTGPDFQLFGAPSYNAGGGTVGYRVPAIPPPPTLIPVQLPNPAIYDLEVMTVSAQLTLVLLETANNATPGPGAVTDVIATLYQNYLPFLSIPLVLAAWGTGLTNNGFDYASYDFRGDVTPQNPFPVYQSDSYGVDFNFQVEQPIPQAGGSAVPTTGATFLYLLFGDLVQDPFVKPPDVGQYTKISFIGSQTAKENLF